jgi:hypothetical protein
MLPIEHIPSAPQLTELLVRTPRLAGFGATAYLNRMTDVAPPLVPRGDENRHIFCQMAIFPPLQDVISAAERASWNELEIMAAIIEVTDNLMLGAGASAEVDELLKTLRRKME